MQIEHIHEGKKALHAYKVADLLSIIVKVLQIPAKDAGNPGSPILSPQAFWIYQNLSLVCIILINIFFLHQSLHRGEGTMKSFPQPLEAILLSEK